MAPKTAQEILEEASRPLRSAIHDKAINDGFSEHEAAEIEGVRPSTAKG